MQRGTGRRDLGQPPLDRGVNVLVGIDECEGARIELFVDPPEPSLDGGQLRGRDDAGRREPSRVRDAAGDVKGVQLVVGVEGR